MNDTAFDHKEYTASLPKRPGVYRMFDADGEILYVGKAKSLKDRVTTYFNPSNVVPKIQALVQQIARIEVTVTNSEAEALLLEYNLIKAHKPRFNIVLRDDKSFPYVHLEVGHDFPRLAFYRGSRSAPGRYFGRTRARCATVSTSCRSCFGSAIAGTAFSPTAAGPACSTRLVAARRPAWG
jgi:excinuclease ABC subunit C